MIKFICKKISWLFLLFRFNKSHTPGRNIKKLWDALRSLNSRMPVSDGNVIDCIREVYDSHQMYGEVGRRFLASTVPLACRYGELERLNEWKDLSFLAEPGFKRDAWTLSLAIPLLVVKGRLGRAADLLSELARSHNNGWLNTECLRFACERIFATQTLGDYGASTRKFCVAFLELLDAFQGDWYSRLHDTELLRSMLFFIESEKNFDSEMYDQIVSGAIKHYGLCSTFWILAEKQKVIHSHLGLVEAHGYWSHLMDLFDHGLEHTKHVSDIAHSIIWFHGRGNQEARVMLREVVSFLAKDAVADIDQLTKLQLQLDASDILRLNGCSIWPTFQSLESDGAMNRLDLVTPKEHASKLLEADLFVVAPMRNEIRLLPHFLAHYRSLGVRTFIIVDNCSDDGTREYLTKQSDVLLYSAETDYRDSCYGVAWQQAVLGNHCVGKWALLADADEFLVYPDYKTIPLSKYLMKASSEGIEGILIFMVDMYPRGKLSNADFTREAPFSIATCYDQTPLIEWYLGSGQYSNSISYLSSLRHRLAKGSSPNSFVSQKIALVRYHPSMRFSAGLHYAANVKLAEESMIFAHFKYDAAFVKRISEEVRRGQHYNQAAEYRQYMQAMEYHGEVFSEKGISSCNGGIDKAIYFLRRSNNIIN